MVKEGKKAAQSWEKEVKKARLEGLEETRLEMIETAAKEAKDRNINIILSLKKKSRRWGLAD